MTLSTSAMPSKDKKESFIIDRCDHAGLKATCGAVWRAVSDTVMGGLSRARLAAASIDGQSCLCLSGEVSLENNGGFVQASLDLMVAGSYYDASRFTGVELEVRGDGKPYNIHLRTGDTRLVWQSYRAGFVASQDWQLIRLPFNEFVPHRISVPLDTSILRKLGIVSIGKGGDVKIYFRRLAFYQ